MEQAPIALANMVELAKSDDHPLGSTIRDNWRPIFNDMVASLGHYGQALHLVEGNPAEITASYETGMFSSTAAISRPTGTSSTPTRRIIFARQRE